MNSAKELLKRLRQDAAGVDAETTLAAFDAEVSRGLAGEPGGLPMIPSLRANPAKLSARGVPFGTVCVDIGGTTLKTARAAVSPDGTVTLSDVKDAPVPGLHGPVTEEEFFREICEFAGVGPDSASLAVSFSHNMRVLPGCDGEITGWCKEITVTAHSDLTVAGLFRRASGNPALRVTVVNDSVASLFGAVRDFRPGDTLLGLVNGTGFNLCWLAPDGTVYNTEAGDSRAFPEGTADRAVDAASELPGSALCEKKVSGVYLSRLVAACRREAEGAEADEAQAAADAAAGAQAPRISDLLRSKDRLTAALTRGILDRSAKIAAVCCEALIRRSGAGRVVIATEGSIVNRIPGYKARFRRELRRLSHGARRITLVSADLAGLRGAARIARMF